MKKLNAFKLSLLAISMAGLGMGCASSGYARYDNDHSMNAGIDTSAGGVGASAGAQVGTDTTTRDHYYRASYDNRNEGSSRVTASALSFSPETRATWVNKFPFYEHAWQLRTIDLYTFAVPDPNLRVASTTDLPEFSVDLPPGSVFVESAGGAGEVRTGRVIQHSPMTGH